MKTSMYALILVIFAGGCHKGKDSAAADTDTKTVKEKTTSESASNKQESTLPQPKTAQEIANEQSAAQFLRHAQPSAEPEKKEQVALPIREVDADHVSVGQFLVNRKEGWIKVRSKVNQNEEILEYLSCGPRGKLHECVLLSYGLPMHLHLALILLGAEPGGKYGTDVMIDVEWKHPETGEIKRHSAARFLYDRLNLRAGQDIVWSFMGSRFMGGQYAANETQSLVSVINDSEAVIGIKNIVGNAHKGPNQGFEGNKETTPPPGTPIDLYIRVPQ